MSLSVEFFAIGDPELRESLRKAIIGALERAKGDWHVSIIAAQDNDIWKLKLRGPNVMREYDLRGIDGQHQPLFLNDLLAEYAHSDARSSLSYLEIPPDTLERITKQGATLSDVQKAVQALSKKWSVSPTAPQAMDEFLARRGVKIKFKSPDSAGIRLPSNAEMVRLKEEFEAEWKNILGDTKALVENLVRGPFLLEFLDGVRNHSTTLREIIYTTALRVAQNENRVLILYALSRESPRMWENVSTAIPRDPIPSITASGLETFLDL